MPAVFPFHVWLPEASVAPTPVTALLHAVAVVKSGVFAIIRVTYFSFGAQVMRGTTAQAIALLLASATIVYGSTMAVKEHHFKRRLAYSTVSNLSYILLAACLMTQSGLVAALAHMLFHALIKITLFFCAGAVMVKTERTQIEDRFPLEIRESLMKMDFSLLTKEYIEQNIDFFYSYISVESKWFTNLCK